MRSTIRISREEYDELREYRFKALFCKPAVLCSSKDDENIRLKKSLIDLKKQLDERDREIKRLKEYNDCLQKTVDRQNQQLTEKELYEKKAKETAPTGVPAIDATVDRLIKLEAKFEAKENPYFF